MAQQSNEPARGREITRYEAVPGQTVAPSTAVAIDGHVGHLQDDPVALVCPACHVRGRTKVKRQAVTCWQQFLALINCCRFCCCCTPICWDGAQDVNHYCGECGCYIGRRITLRWYKRALFRLQRGDLDGEDNAYQVYRRVDKRTLDDAAMRQRAQRTDTV